MNKKLWLIFIFLLLGGFFVTSFAQQGSVKGLIKAHGTGAALKDVFVTSSRGKQALSNDKGEYRIAAQAGDSLFYNYLGYSKYMRVVGSGENTVNVELFPDATSLNEVVITALGISRTRKSLGYSVQELKSGDITTAKSNNLVNSLAGKLAGVRITNSQGNMGSSRIIIRGETSIAGNNQPLFIVDGIPVDNSQLGSGSSSSRDFANTVSDINPEDIESISVLKGPTAAALYGSRAAHGVILIKTKTGRSKKGLGITVNTNNVFDQALVLPSYQNIFGQGANGEFSYVDGKGGGLNDAVDESWGPKMQGQLIPQFGSNGVAVPFVAHPNNVKDYFQTGFTTDNSIAVADAGDTYNYRLSYNNSHQTGITPNTALNKQNFSVNTSFKVSPKLTVTAVGNYYITESPNLPGVRGRRATSTMLQFIWLGRQVDFNKLKDSYFSTGSPDNWNNAYYPNPYFAAYNNTVSQRRDRLIGDIGFKYDILEGLSVHFHSAVDYYNDRRKLRIAYGTSGTPYGSYEEDAYALNENNTELTLNYDKNLNSDFSLSALVGGNIRNNSYEENDQKAPRLAVAGVYTLTNSRDALISSNFLSRQRVYSTYGSAQVGFRNYAFVNITARNDWSSTLPPGHQSYFYPSVNGTLVWSDLLKLKGDFLSYGKVRAGWANVGSDASPYQLANIFNFGTPFNGYPQLTTSGVKYDPNLKSESTSSTELGIENGFFDNRIHLDVSVYNTNSYNQILSVNVPAGTGYTSQVRNAGKINNKGIEIELGVEWIRAKDFRWNTDLNFAANRSKVIYLDKSGQLQSYLLGSDGTAQVVAEVGKPYGTIVGIAYQRDAKGNIIVGADGLPKTDPTEKDLGHFSPNWNGGITNTFSYKNYSLSFLIDASIGGKLFSGTNATGNYTGVLAQTLPGRDKEYGGLAYYYAGNDKSTLPIAVSGTAPAGATVYNDGIIVKGVDGNGNNNKQIVPAVSYYKALYNIDEQYVYNASYVKFRELRIGYAFPSGLLKKVGIQNAVLSLVGRNLWIIYKDVPNIDPETAFNIDNGQGLEDLTYPSTRSFGVNLNLKF